MNATLNPGTLASPRTTHHPRSFSRFQLHTLMNDSANFTHHSRPTLQRILDRIIDLRGSSISWAFGTPSSRLIETIPGSAHPSFIAPLTLFKIRAGLWVPKVIIRAVDDDLENSLTIHNTCRRAGIEFMSITTSHISAGYLDSKDFKRAFNGAFFCDESINQTIFCPTLRNRGTLRWSA